MGSQRENRSLAVAARWHARLAAPDCTPQDRLDFDAWRRQSAEHEQAHELAMDVSSALDDLLMTDPALRAMAAEALGESNIVEPTPAAQMAQTSRPVRRPRWIVPTTLAASLLITAIGARLTFDFFQRAPDSVSQLVTDGTRRDVRLADGSIVHLDIASEVDTRLSGKRREIELVRGRALFEVAHDTERPFTVSTGSVRVMALGTRFQVQRDEDRTVVTLTQGSIVVSDSAAAATWQEVLAPGEQLVFAASESASPLKRVIDPRTATSWMSGRHVFKATPLAEAIDEVNRYSGTKLRLGDPDLADLVVGGSFNAGDSASVVAAFAAALPLRVVDAGSEVILFRRYRPESD